MMSFISSIPQVYTTVIDEGTETQITHIVKEVLSDYDIEACDFQFAMDHDNEPLIIIDLCDGVGQSNIKSTEYMELISRTRKYLLLKGDIRFPMFNHVFN